MTFKVKDGVQVGSILALDANAKLTTGLSTARTIALSGDVAGSTTFDGTGNVTISTTIQANSVALGTDTTGNYMVNVAAGTGVSVSHTQGEGSTATVSIGQPVATTDNVTFANINATGNVVVDGNLTVSGTTVTISATNLAVEDNMIYLNNGSTVSNPDLGFAGNYNDGSYKHAGFFRDATDGRWKVFQGYTLEPDASAFIDTAHASFALADIQASTFHGALSGNASTASKWATARTLSYTGDATGSMSVDGSANASAALTLANSGVTAGTYGSGTAIPVLTIDAKGRVTSATTSAVTIGTGTLALSIGTAGATNTTVTVGTGSGFNANSTSNYTYDIKVGPALTALATLMTSGSTGFIKRTGVDTYSIDTNTYLTGTKVDSISATSPIVASASTGAITLSHANSGVTAGTYNNVTVNATGHITSASNVSYLTSYTETDTLATVTGRGATTSTAISLTGSSAINTTTPGTVTYGLNFTGQSTADYAQAITWGWSTSGAQAGVYVQSSGAYGTKMYLATTDSFASGSKTAISIDHSGIVQTTRNYLQATGSLRAPIFYDSDNTSYYVDPSSTSISAVFAGPIVSAGGLQSTTSGYTTPYNIFTLSNTYNGSTFYGIKYVEGNPDTIQFIGANNIGLSVGMDTGITIANASLRAPIFYDSDNTGYYVDPNSSTSAIFAGNVDIRIQNEENPTQVIYLGANNGDAAGTSNDIGTGIIFAPKYSGYTKRSAGIMQIGEGNYFRSGLAFYTNGTSNATTDWSERARIDMDGNFLVNQQTISYTSMDNSPVVGSITSNILHINGSIQLANNNDAIVFGRGTSTFLKDEELGFGWGGGWYMTDSDYLRVRGSKILYNNYIIRSDADMRAPIFYDQNDTSYYLDPNSYSFLWRLNVHGQYSSDTAGSAIYIGGQNVSTSNSLWINFHSDGDAAYRIGKPAGTWTQPLEIRFYTGIRHRAHSAYGGHRFINYNSDSTRFSVADGDDNVRSIGSFYAPIMYDYNDTSYYLDPNSTGTSLSIAGTIEQGNNYAHPNIEWSASGTSTGEVIFYLPGTTANYGMVHMVFDIYEYDSNNACTVIVGGHNWSSSWYNVGVDVIGYTNKSVRLGVKDGRFVVVFGGTTSSWSYGQIRLRKVQNGSYYNNSMDLGGNWSVVQTTTESFSNISGDLRELRTSNTMYAYAYRGHSNVAGTGEASYHPAGVYSTGTNWLYGSIITNGNYVDTGGGAIYSAIFYDNNNTGYYVDPSSTTYINTLTAAGNITANSDIRLKRDIVKIDNAIEKVKKLNGVTFTRIDVEDTTKRYAGLIAQEVLEVLPEAVEGTATYSVAYGNMVGLLVEAIKEQQSEIDELKALVKQLLAK